MRSVKHPSIPRLKTRIESMGFGVRTIVALPTRQFGLELGCPCGRIKWLRVPFERPLVTLRNHLIADGLLSAPARPAAA